MAATAAAQAPADEVKVKVVDREGRPVPGAKAWTLPVAAWHPRSWMPVEHVPYCSNPHELLRRVGDQVVADEAGELSVLRGTIVAAEHGGLAGVATVAEPALSSFELRLDESRWTIEVRLPDRTPVVGVPIECSVTDFGMGGLSLGLTDASGRLVVRAPSSVELARSLPIVDGAQAAAPRSVRFQVDGMYLDAHAGTIDLQDPTSTSVALILPPVTVVEVQVPEWHGALSDFVEFTRVGKGFEWDQAWTWVAAGKLQALVGVHGSGQPTRVAAVMVGSEIRAVADVLPLPPGRTQVMELALDRDDIIVRGRIHSAPGRPAAHAVLETNQIGGPLRTRWVRADRAGRFALVLRRYEPGTELRLEVDASPEPRLVGATVTLALDVLRAGDRRDVGILTLEPR